MALSPAKLQKELEAAITSALTKQFASEAAADPTSHQRQAAAIAEGVAVVIVKTLTTDAEIPPGIKTAGSAASQTTVTAGKII